MNNRTTVNTRVGTFEVFEYQCKVIVSKNGKNLATLPDVNPWDKDTIVNAIEQNGERLNELAAQPVAVKDLTPDNVLSTLSEIYALLETTIEDKQTKGFVTSRLKQVINKLAA